MLARSEDAGPLAVTALVAASFAFHIFSPHQTRPDVRYFTVIAGPMIGLSTIGAAAVAGLVRQGVARRVVTVVLITTAFGFTAAGAISALPACGPSASATPSDAIDADRGLAGRGLLVVSDEHREGALVSDVAVRGRRPRPAVVRGSKFLGSDDWMGRNRDAEVLRAPRTS